MLMKRRKGIKLSLIVVLLASIYNLGSSQVENGKYVIVTFEHTYKQSQHGKESFYWVVPNDSINSYETSLSKIFLDGFSVNNLEDCCEGKQIDPFLVFDDSRYDLDEDYLQSLSRLKSLIKEKRRKVQSIKKKWTNGQSVRISVYVTPIIGSFCSSEYHVLGQARNGYDGLVYLPYLSDFKVDKSFWQSLEVDYLLSRDFSKIHYDLIR